MTRLLFSLLSVTLSASCYLGYEGRTGHRSHPAPQNNDLAAASIKTDIAMTRLPVGTAMTICWLEITAPEPSGVSNQSTFLIGGKGKMLMQVSEDLHRALYDANIAVALGTSPCSIAFESQGKAPYYLRTVVVRYEQNHQEGETQIAVGLELTLFRNDGSFVSSTLVGGATRGPHSQLLQIRRASIRRAVDHFIQISLRRGDLS